MLETRGARKRRRLALLPPLPELPLNVLANVLFDLDIASLVRLAACSKELRRQMYEEHTILWKVIDFGNVDSQVASLLTDLQLEAILRRCGARDRCRVLKLTGCTGISGTGFEPLRGSRQLREADLRLNATHHVVGPVELNTGFVLPLLSSMPPVTVPPEMPDLPDGLLGLTLVKFRRQHDEQNYFDCFADDVADWLDQFRDALVTQATQRRLPRCGCCQTIIIDVAIGEDSPWILATNYCEHCETYFCGELNYSCIMDLCKSCSNHTCYECLCERSGSICYECCDYYCSDTCAHECSRCNKCDNIFCSGCKAGHEGECTGSDSRNT